MIVSEKTLSIKIGDVFLMADGVGLRIEKYEEDGKFAAQVRSYSTGEWTDYRITGDSVKLPLFLEAGKAVKETTNEN